MTTTPDPGVTTPPTDADDYPVVVGHENQGYAIYDWCDETCDEDCTADHKGEQ